MTTSSRIPISVRISQQDADFIAGLNLEDAHTPSDKIRALLSEARLQHEKGQSYAQLLQRAETALTPAKHRLLVAEHQLQWHSALLKLIFDSLPDLQAALNVDFDSSGDKGALLRYEKDILARIVRLLENVLQLAVTAENPCYDADVLNRSLEKTLSLADLIRQRMPDQP